jgi:hypothetical protein
MNIYKLQINGDDFGLVHIKEKILRRAFYSLQAFSHIENTVDLEVISDKKLPLANISYFGGAFPICFDKISYYLLKKYLNESGEIQEGKVEGKKDSYYIFWPSKILDCLDEDNSDILVMPSGYKRLVKPVFFEDKIPPESIFIVPQFKSNSLFITEDIAEKLRSSDLTGYILEEVEQAPQSFTA